MRLKDKVAIITGAGNGIGRATAIRFANEGASVVVADIDDEGGEETVRTIRDAGGAALFTRTDVSDDDQIQAMVEATHDAFGPVDILVNNAAYYPRSAWTEITEAEWDRMMAVNLKSCFLCSRAVYPDMQARGAGKIINVSSVTFLLGQPLNNLHYISSKGGIVGFTRALAREVGDACINVNCITPGAIQTEAEKRLFPDQERLAEEMAELQCITRRGVPNDVAGVMVFLASSDSDFMSGQTVNVDGGWAMY